MTLNGNVFVTSLPNGTFFNNLVHILYSTEIGMLHNLTKVTSQFQEKFLESVCAVKCKNHT